MKFKSFIIALINLLVFCGCVGEQSNLQKYPEIAQSDFAILGQSYSYVMDISEEGELKRLCSIPLDINSRKLMDWSFVKGDDCMYAYSSANSDITVNLVRIDSTDYSVREKKLDEYGIYSYCADDEYYYAAYAYTDRTDFVKYDSQLNEKERVSLEADDCMQMPVSMQMKNGRIYIIMGKIPNGGEYGEISNHLLIMDTSFHVESETDLRFTDGAYNDSVIAGDKMYLTVRTKGFDDQGAAYPANEIHIFDLNTMEISDEVIYLSESCPEYIEYDPLHDNLVIRHNRDRLGDCIFTVFSLTDRNEVQIRLSDWSDGEETPLSAMDCIAEDAYYILADNILLVYDPLTSEIRKYDLSEYAMNAPHSVIARTK